MEIVRADDILSANGLKPPVLSALVADVNNYSVLLAQPQGVIDASAAGVRNRDRASAQVVFGGFIDKAVEMAADLAVTPEYSMPWEILIDALLGGKVPASGKLWAFGCESLTLTELNARRAQLGAAAVVLFEDIASAGNRFLDPLVYVFVTQPVDNAAEKLVLLVQFKTYPMGDTEHFEIAHLQPGRRIYQFGDLATGLRLASLICSDAFGFTDAEARLIYDRALVLHIQLNPSPRQHQYRFYREMLFRPHGDATELLCLNWASSVCEWYNGQEKAWRNPGASAWYLRPKEFDDGDASLCANHRRGLYYTWLNTSRAHALFLNYGAGVYLIEATKVAHIAVPASVSRRIGPKLRAVFSWQQGTGALVDQPEASDGFSAVIGEAGAARANVQQLYDASPLAAERALALCAGKVRAGERWYAVKELDSFCIDPSEVVRRITFCQDVEGHDFRVARLRRCANLWQILSDRTNLPPALSDIGDGFRLDWHEARPHQNVISTAGRAATVIYLGEEQSDAELDAVGTSIAEWLRLSAPSEDEGIAARQRTAIWHRRNGELVLVHAPERYARFDDPRNRSEVDLTRQAP